MSHSILHTVNQSPFNHNILDQCLNYAAERDTILLLENGVYGALLNQPLADKLSQRKCYAIETDLKARGLLEQELAPHIQLINFTYFVRLSAEHKLTQSWY